MHKQEDFLMRDYGFFNNDRKYYLVESDGTLKEVTETYYRETTNKPLWRELLYKTIAGFAILGLFWYCI